MLSRIMSAFSVILYAFKYNTIIFVLCLFLSVTKHLIYLFKLAPKKGYERK